MKQLTVNKEVLTVLARIDDSGLMERFLLDMLTPNEIEEIGRRWELVKLLNDGVPQREIAKRLGISLGKISRGAHEIKYGHDGFREALTLLHEPAKPSRSKS